MSQTRMMWLSYLNGVICGAALAIALSALRDLWPM